METLVSGQDYKGDYYHTTEEHGPMWTLLNQMLHIIVLVYTVFGMIRFRVTFIHYELIKWVSFLTVFLNWYISAKFALLAMIFYLFNMELNSRKITLLQFNCSLEQYENFLLSNITISSKSPTTDTSSGNKYTHSFYVSTVLANLLNFFGGPYQLLGNRATLMYGFFSLSIFLMLALFPLEHYYFNIGFNYTRFVLNDPSCLRNLYANKQKHLDRLNNWSRNMNSSMLTLSMKRAISQRELRSSYLYEIIVGPVMRQLKLSVTCNNNKASARPTTHKSEQSPTELQEEGVEIEVDEEGIADDESGCDLHSVTTTKRQLDWYDETYGHFYSKKLPIDPTSSASLDNLSLIGPKEPDHFENHHFPPPPEDSELYQNTEVKLNAPVRSLRHTLSTNHSNEPSYDVKVANRNLTFFKPYVRSKNWFKISMIIYPIFIFFYFTLLMIVIGAITIFFTNTLKSLTNICVNGLKARGFFSEASRQMETFTDWSLWDKLTFWEGKYSVFALSCASSFYCSYYFGTIIELVIWLEEISQQLNLCRIIMEFIEVNPPPITLVTALAHTKSNRLPIESQADKTQQEGTIAIITPDSHHILESLFPYHETVKDSHLVGRNFNQFGGLNSIWAHCKFKMAPQSERFRKYELMAIKLATKKQTISRAAYINLNLFFDELNDTRFMTTIILRRTTQIVFGLALMVSITRSQFETTVIDLSVLLISCLAILNLYLICAAFINSSINKLLPQIHALISVSIMAGTDHDLLEFWLRHIQAYGLDMDAMCYRIYGYKVTWSTILNLIDRNYGYGRHKTTFGLEFCVPFCSLLKTI